MLVPLVAVAVVAAVYFGGVAAFSYYFMPSTSINGKNVSLVAASDLAKQVSDKGATYKTHVDGRGLDLEITSADIDLAYNGEEFVQAALSQIDKWRWPLELVNEHRIDLVEPITYDADKLSKKLQKAVAEVNQSREAPVNASIGYDPGEKKFIISREKQGTMLSVDSVEETVSKGITALQAEIEITKDDLVQPEILYEDERLATAERIANGYLNNEVELTVNNKKVYTVASKTILDWIGVDDGLNVTLDEQAAKVWAQGPLSKEMDTVGAKRTFKRKDGKKVTVTGGTYGWIINGAELSEALIKQIKSNNKDQLEIPMKQKGNKWAPGGADWRRYIDVDLSEQKARMYDDSGDIIWESSIVSGKPSKKEDHATPEGVYTVLNKATDQTLIGLDENKDGKADYKSKVKYWMPFNGNLIGLHDASWRTKFGGSIYKSDGSHGCVNLPSSSAEELYSIIKVGDVVCVHK